MPRAVKIRFPHYWIELPHDLPISALARALSHTRLNLAWDIKARRLEIKATKKAAECRFEDAHST